MRNPPVCQQLLFALLCLAATAVLLLTGALPAARSSSASDPPDEEQNSCSLIDDFEGYQAGDTPSQWYTNEGRNLIPANANTMSQSHHLSVESEGENKFVRIKMQGYAYRLIKLNGKHFAEWNTEQCPILEWKWRVMDYPEGASEKNKDNNDVAAAVYVTFGRDWLGRPKSIKYTFSSTLPVGTIASYGQLKVLVVASAKDGSPVGEWMTMQRNVVRDYQNLFGEAPGDDTPTGIQLFSDADVSASHTATADFDDVYIRASR